MVFEDGADIYLLRQLVAERLQSVKEEIPEGLSPQLAPIATGLGEIFYYAVHYTDKAENLPESPKERLMSLKIIHDLTVKPLLRATPGITEINTTGGYEKQIVIQPYPERLTAVGMTFEDVAEKISMNTENAGGGLIELGGEQVVIRGNNRVADHRRNLQMLPLKFGAGVEPLLVGDVAEIENRPQLPDRRGDRACGKQAVARHCGHAARREQPHGLRRSG